MILLSLKISPRDPLLLAIGAWRSRLSHQLEMLLESNLRKQILLSKSRGKSMLKMPLTRSIISDFWKMVPFLKTIILSETMASCSSQWSIWSTTPNLKKLTQVPAKMKKIRPQELILVMKQLPSLPTTLTLKNLRATKLGSKVDTLGLSWINRSWLRTKPKEMHQEQPRKLMQPTSQSKSPWMRQPLMTQRLTLMELTSNTFLKRFKISLKLPIRLLLRPLNMLILLIINQKRSTKKMSQTTLGKTSMPVSKHSSRNSQPNGLRSPGSKPFPKVKNLSFLNSQSPTTFTRKEFTKKLWHTIITIKLVVMCSEKMPMNKMCTIGLSIP